MIKILFCIIIIIVDFIEIKFFFACCSYSQLNQAVLLCCMLHHQDRHCIYCPLEIVYWLFLTDVSHSKLEMNFLNWRGYLTWDEQGMSILVLEEQSKNLALSLMQQQDEQEQVCLKIDIIVNRAVIE